MKYQLKQMFTVMDEKEKLEKGFDVQIGVNARGMTKEQIGAFFQTVSCGCSEKQQELMII